jgi:nucleoside-diphosphate-sugar epimerase
MTTKAAITVYRPRAELQRLWQSSDYRPEYIDAADAAVTFVDAPGDRGTEIHVDLDIDAPAGKLGEIVQKLFGSEPRAKVMDDLRRFKQLVETGVIARSDATPEGELAERKFKQRPAQPLDDSELQKVGV